MPVLVPREGWGRQGRHDSGTGVGLGTVFVAPLSQRWQQRPSAPICSLNQLAAASLL